MQDNWLQSTLSDDDSRPESAAQEDALRLCSRLLGRIVSGNGRLLIATPIDQLSRILRVYATSASLKETLGRPCLDDLSHSLHLVIRPPTPYKDDECFTFRDLLVSTIVSAWLCSASMRRPLPVSVLQALDLGDNHHLASSRISNPDYSLLHHVNGHADIISILLDEEGKVVPSLLLDPDQTLRLPMLLFSSSLGCLPTICKRSANGTHLEPPLEAVRQGVHFAASSMLLRMAKHIQDYPTAKIISIPGFPDGLSANGSLLLVIYMLALALFPSAAIYNNLGLVLASLAPIITVDHGGRAKLSEEIVLAQSFFERGLKLDEFNPHLLTNLASLMKDQGRLQDAIR